MPSYTAVGTLQANVKCLSLYNVGLGPPFLEAEPADWYLPGFDDSGWSSSANPSGSTGPATIHRLPNDAPELALAAGIQEGVAPSALTPTDETTPPYNNGFVVVHWLNRWTFTRPSASWELYLLEERTNGLSNSGVATAYLNGTFVGPVGTSGTNVSMATVEAALTSGSNLLAWKTQEVWLPSYAGYHTFRLLFFTPDPGGKPVAWGTVAPGVNDQGVLGIGDTDSHLVPTYMRTDNFPDPTDPQVVKIASNGRTTFLLANRGELYVCGDDDDVMHLDGSPGHAILTPVRLTVSTANFVDVAVGGDSVLALDRGGGVYVMGLNAQGSAGTGNTNAVPSLTRVGTGALVVGTGEAHSVYGTADVVVAAGDNQYGQLGDGTTTDRLSWTETLVPGGEIPLDIAVGGSGNLLFTDSGGGLTSVFVWGRAEFGSLGFDAFDAGTGTHKIVSTPLTTSFLVEGGVAIHDQMAIMSSGPLTEITGVGFTSPTLLGDGTPYGGAADGDGTIVYGTDVFNATQPNILKSLGPTTTVDDIVGIADSGGLVNEWASGDSRATLAAIAREYDLVVAVNESYAGLALLQGAGSQDQYLWPNGDSSQVYMLPTDTREVSLTVQNVAGGGANPTVTMRLDVYNGQLPTGTLVDSNSTNVVVGQTRTITLTSLNAPGFGVRAWLSYSGTPPRTNTVNATFQIRTIESTTDVLYTWGYGGYGQMGNGLTTATNLFAISQNGLSGVSQVCLARRVAFAVAETGAVTQVGAGRSWAMVIG